MSDQFKPVDPIKLARGLRMRLEAMQRAGGDYATIASTGGDLMGALKRAIRGQSTHAGSPASLQPSASAAARKPASQGPKESEMPKFKPVVTESVAALRLRKYGGEASEPLAKMAEKVAKCAACGLCETRNETVFSRGNPRSPLMLIGEAPGADEDKQGLPFVGRAGKLLDDILEKGMGYDPESAYVANVLKCRPPGNRNPEPTEIEACRGFLQKQIEIVDPMVIIALGRFPAQWLLESKSPIGKLRGKMWEMNGRKIVATYHPAYLLRNPAAKRDVWNDVQIVMDFFGRGKPLPMRE